MKKLFLGCALASMIVVATNVYATGSTYIQDRINQGYGTTTPAGYDGQRPVIVPSSYQAPVSARSYGFYQKNVANQGTSRQLVWYPTMRQRAESLGQPPYDYGDGAQTMWRPPQQSPVYSETAPRKRFFYVGAHVGAGNTSGWKGSVKHPAVPVWGLTLGTKATPNVRADVEFLYHTKAKLINEGRTKVDYRQYELGGNLYYDFPSQGVVRPFIGGGLWGVKGKVSGHSYGRNKIDADSGMKLGLSVAAGMTYAVDEMFSLMAMLRARYITTKDDLYNLEGLLGARYHF